MRSSQFAGEVRRAYPGERESVSCETASGLKDARFRQWRIGEAGSGRAPDGTMMQAADFGNRDNRAEF